ncbi:GntR family transcriptional regulator [Brevibacillus reuszeri]|uniref:GntR family transcriptional regulator n=1 Tax=Brevibacillus reuszeri TaxID=54915 RepID=A0A0K9YJ36_9BACL|nr:PLP-dependent aminotransferase family protein [Brevibacillus reuszeri]KNB68676.1 GntR family transcriptional regulator [Brevibacillus reuszeri]MED1858966.1 PLP-dependent aminotransferase family protein [Brevibacillus reuszeri]GED69182.1 GntR family transcriptional regulator [Brevibacillus reuszeri]
MARNRRSQTSQQPKYQQIIDYIRGRISTGEWPIGSKIPSQRVLAEQFGVNRSTVITALEELMADGLIEGKMGMGTVVVNNTWTLLATTPPPDWNEYVKSGLHKPSLTAVRKINQDEFDPDLIQLSKGELSPDIFPLDTMKFVMEKVTGQLGRFGYEEPRGYYPLRQALSEYLRRKGIEASPSSILIVSGALQALQLISVGLLHRGSTVLLEQPSYLYSLHVFQSAGMQLTGLQMDPYGLKPDDIVKRRRQENSSILYTIPCFHNPTGILMSESRRAELMRVCEAERLPVIEDDIYRELWIEAPPPPPLKARDKHGHVLYVGSLSKTLTPGLRIGWVVGPEPVIERLSDLKMQTDYGASSLSSRVAAEWLASGLYEEHMGEVREQLKIRRAAVIAALQKHLHDLATWEVPQGGFLIWLKINDKLSMMELFGKALRHGILLNPGNIYGQEPEGYLRISYGYASLEDLETGIERLGEIIRSLRSV